MKKLALVLAFAAACNANATCVEDKSSTKPAPVQAKPSRMFVIDTHYIVDPSRAAPHKESHKKWVEKYSADGTFLYAGPKDDKNGGVMIIEGRDKEQVAKIMSEDAFVKEGIVGMKITEFNPLPLSRK